ncbi:MAG: hypothetical protein GEU87_10620 [Alphaproteobacteria bacterium]|nr:hypothetical protein [Alphaproteobacteria bacterium]
MLGDYGLPLLTFAAVLLLTFIRRDDGSPAGVVVDFPASRTDLRRVAPAVAKLDDACERSRVRLARLGVDVDRLPVDIEPLEVVAAVHRELLTWCAVRHRGGADERRMGRHSHER